MPDAKTGLVWKDDGPTITTKITWRAGVDGIDLEVRETPVGRAYWNVFAKLDGFDVMASGNTKDAAQAKQEALDAFNMLVNRGATGRQ